MTTIKLKNPQNNKEEIFSAGQFFKDTDGYVYALSEESAGKLCMICVRNNDFYKVKGEKITFKDSDATLNFLSENINETLTPISVTISED